MSVDIILKKVLGLVIMHSRLECTVWKKLLINARQKALIILTYEFAKLSFFIERN